MVADYNIRFQALKEEEELKRHNLIATISAEFDTKAERFYEETALKHQQELVQFKREQLQHQSDHNKQLEDIAAVVKSLQAESAAKDKELDELRLKDRQKELTKVKPSSPVAGSNLEYLRHNIFDFVPNTVTGWTRLNRTRLIRSYDLIRIFLLIILPHSGHLMFKLYC